MKRSDLEVYQKIYIECHNLFIVYAPRTDEPYAEFVAAAEVSRKKIGDHPFWFRLLKLTTDEIEKVWKGDIKK